MRIDMRIVRRAFQWSIFGRILLCCMVSASAQVYVGQAGRCADGSSHPMNFNCQAYLCSNGWAQAHWGPSACGSSGNVSTGPSAAELEAEREAREAEQRRIAEEEQRKVAEQQRLDAERKQREHDEWVRSRDDAYSSLKGVSVDDMDLKGVGGQTNFFGLKGFSPDEASATIKTDAPDAAPHSVTGAWQQLHCAAELASDVVADMKKIETGVAAVRELDEIKFVAGQASTSLSGGQITVECSAAPPLNVHLSGSDIERQMPVLNGLVTRAVSDAQTYVNSMQKVDELRRKLDALKAQKAVPAPQQPNSTPQNAPASTSQPGSGFSQSAEQQKINEAIQQQKEYQKSHEDYYALLREVQRALNEANSQKIASQADADKVQKETQAILSGHIPSAPGATQSQVQNQQPGDQP